MTSKLPDIDETFSIVPPEFLQDIGYLNIQQTRMDEAVDRTIGALANIDESVRTAILAPIMNISTRLGILTNLLSVSELEPKEKCKLETIRREIGELSSRRNRILHDLPMAFSPSDGTVMYVRRETDGSVAKIHSVSVSL